MISLNVTPSRAWGQDKKVVIDLLDTSLAPTDTPEVVVMEEGSSPVNKVDINLTFDTATGHFIGEVYLTNGTASGSPVLTLSNDCTVQVIYGGSTPIAISSIGYTIEEPQENGMFVEVRSSVRNLHWDIVTILCKAGWKFVETLPPRVTTQGYLTAFCHVLKTVTTPQADDTGNAAATEMFLVVEHTKYPGNNSGNFKEIQFKLTPNYYYYDSIAQGSTPSSAYNDTLYVESGIYKLAEFPTYPLRLNFLASAVSEDIPNVLDIPVNIWGYASRDAFSLIFQGEPSLTANGFGQVSHIYCGQVQSFKEGKLDIGGNFTLSGTSVNPIGGTRYGTYTSDGASTLAMYRTYGGLLWQSHFSSIIPDDPSGEGRKSELYQPSSWTGKFHLSPVYIFHPTDGKRGFLKHTLAVNKQGILHLDELEIVRPVDECNPCPIGADGNPVDPNDLEHPEYDNVWKREKYKYYRLTAGSHFLKSFDTISQYKGIGVAIKMETDPAKIIKFNTSYDIVSGRGVSSWTGIGAIPHGAELAGARTESIAAGLVKLNSGGDATATASFSGDFRNLNTISSNDTNVIDIIRAEFLTSEDPLAVQRIEVAVTCEGQDGVEKSTIFVDFYRAPDLDGDDNYGFRGTVYIDELTNETDNTLHAVAGDKIKFTYSTQTVTITM